MVVVVMVVAVIVRVATRMESGPSVRDEQRRLDEMAARRQEHHR